MTPQLNFSQFLFDTNAVLYFLGGRVSGPLPKGQFAISVITEIELFSYPNLTEAEEKKITVFLHKIKVIGLTEEIKNQAIQLRRRHKLKIPDAIIMASAISIKATLLTNDTTLVKLSEISTKPLPLH